MLGVRGRQLAGCLLNKSKEIAEIARHRRHRRDRKASREWLTREAKEDKKRPSWFFTAED